MGGGGGGGENVYLEFGFLVSNRLGNAGLMKNVKIETNRLYSILGTLT